MSEEKAPEQHGLEPSFSTALTGPEHFHPTPQCSSCIARCWGGSEETEQRDGPSSQRTHSLELGLDANNKSNLCI